MLTSELKCVRLLVSATKHQRSWFRWKFHDWPWVVEETYRYITPQTSGGSGLGFGDFMHFTDVQKIKFTFTWNYYFKTEKECDARIYKRVQEAVCVECQTHVGAGKCKIPAYSYVANK